MGVGGGLVWFGTRLVPDALAHGQLMPQANRGCPVPRPAGLLTAPVPRGGTHGREMPPCLCVWRARGRGAGRACWWRLQGMTGPTAAPRLALPAGAGAALVFHAPPAVARSVCVRGCGLCSRGRVRCGGGHTGPTPASLSTWKNQESLRVVAGSSLCGLGCWLEGPAVAHTCRGK